MAYNKYVWQTGEVITAPKLNHIENGIAESGGGRPAYVFQLQILNEHPRLVSENDAATYQDIVELYTQGYDLYVAIGNSVEPIIYSEDDHIFYTEGRQLNVVSIDNTDDYVTLCDVNWTIVIETNGYNDDDNYYQESRIKVPFIEDEPVG